jgi:hypothetical protein
MACSAHTVAQLAEFKRLLRIAACSLSTFCSI